MARACGRRHKYKLLTSTTESSDMRQFHGTLTAKDPISPFVISKSHPCASNKLLIACAKEEKKKVLQLQIDINHQFIGFLFFRIIIS